MPIANIGVWGGGGVMTKYELRKPTGGLKTAVWGPLQNGPKGNHLKERLLDQAHIPAIYPLLGGHWRGIPQWVILDVQPPTKSSFWETKLSPNEFFKFESSTPCTQVPLFWEGGVGGGGGGSKLLCVFWPQCVNLDPGPKYCLLIHGPSNNGGVLGPNSRSA